MPSFTTTLPDLRRMGPICRVQIGLSIPTTRQLQVQNLPIPPPYEINALIDTGASGTAINSEVVQNLSLVPRGITLIATPYYKRTSLQCLRCFSFAPK